jgi:serine/threonine protein kinase
VVKESQPPSAWEDLLGDEVALGDVLAEKYLLEKLLGKGAMGVVIKARHVQLDEPVAVKFLLPKFTANEEALARFEREARAAFKIKSEHVSRVLDVGRLKSGAPFMVMEFLEGTELAVVLDEEAPLPFEQGVDYVLQACEAIAEAHALGIVHRDLKPENLFVTRRRDGSACLKVLDFGLSKLLPTDPNKRQRALTTTEQVMGTAHYMSPEQWMSTKDVGPETDIWSLGVILYETITGHSPFLRDKLAQMCNAVLRDSPQPLAELRDDAPEGLEQVILRCIEKKPEGRYADMGELAAALTPFASEAGKTLARRIARRVEMGPMSSGGLPPASMRGAPNAPPSGPAAVAEAEPAPLPKLGIRDDFGNIETWQELIQEGPPQASRRPLLIGVGLVLLVLLLLGMAFSTGADEAPARPSPPPTAE